MEPLLVIGRISYFGLTLFFASLAFEMLTTLFQAQGRQNCVVAEAF